MRKCGIEKEKNESEQVRGGNSVLAYRRARNDINQVTTMLTDDTTRMFKRRCCNKAAKKTSKFWKSFNCSLGWDELKLCVQVTSFFAESLTGIIANES